MAKLKEELWNTLQDLKEEEFKTFKWFLKEDDPLREFSRIPVAQLEKAEREETVDLMVQRYQGPGALERTRQVLEKIGRNDLKQSLHNFSFGPKVLKGAQREKHKKRTPELKCVQRFAVDVTLDLDTAHPQLILSDDGKQVHHGDVTNNFPDHPKRFFPCIVVLGEQSFSSGRFYYEVQVKGKPAWTLGVAKESVQRKGDVTLCPEEGFWAVWLRDGGQYTAKDSPAVRLSLRSPPQKVGVFVDMEEGVVSFYDVDTADVIYSFTGCSFTEKLYPFFCPWSNNGGTNSAPFIICPVNIDE